MRFSTDQMYLKSPEEMYALFPGQEEALANTVRIAERCEVELEFGKLLLPHFPPPPPFTRPGRVSAPPLQRGAGAAGTASGRRSWASGCDYELRVIRQMGYAGYFLIVQDFINYARSAGRAGGAGARLGRGQPRLLLRSGSPTSTRSATSSSSSGSSIRSGSPCPTSTSTSPTGVAPGSSSTWWRSTARRTSARSSPSAPWRPAPWCGTSAASWGCRTSRSTGSPRSVPAELKMTLDKALEQSPELKALHDGDEQVRELIGIARVLEGLARHASTHAAGVVITPTPLTDYVPLFRTKDDEVTTQFDMGACEKIGLLKMDFLGLRTLTVLQDCLEMLQQRGRRRRSRHAAARRSRDLRPLLPRRYGRDLPVRVVGDDRVPAQTPARGPRRPDRDERPLPSRAARVGDDRGLHRAQARPPPIHYEHPLLEPILKETYGVIVYQEQVMQIASALAGYSLGEADLLRRAMGKKKQEIMDEQRAGFIERALAPRHPEDGGGEGLRPHGALRRLRLQQVALRRLRRRRLPDRLPQGQPSRWSSWPPPSPRRCRTPTGS